MKGTYVTQKAWGAHPAGSTCEVSRQGNGPLVLVFSDGATFTLEAHYAPGLEEPPQVPLGTALSLSMHDRIMREIDEQIMAEL